MGYYTTLALRLLGALGSSLAASDSDAAFSFVVGRLSFIAKAYHYTKMGCD